MHSFKLFAPSITIIYYVLGIFSDLGIKQWRKEDPVCPGEVYNHGGGESWQKDKYMAAESW
jgi:hypothetical protein